jgi:hypothetical protein
LKEVQDKERDSDPPGWGLGLGLTFFPHRNSVVSNPRQRVSHGLKTGRSAIEEEEEEEEGINRLQWFPNFI